MIQSKTYGKYLLIAAALVVPMGYFALAGYNTWPFEKHERPEI
ncbi:MAG TPA: hypothetical protein VLS85_06215 [Hanamia sp.]|nr:hypothetical protein [Hanamia sp.]